MTPTGEGQLFLPPESFSKLESSVVEVKPNDQTKAALARLC